MVSPPGMTSGTSVLSHWLIHYAHSALLGWKPGAIFCFIARCLGVFGLK
ncbi:hypothetical protein Tsubulata_007383 [Turnera subulata]|uniref:Uncharacterized protein n=1 Tax=Turnera subulata TaxID=218843 RepID=A0A9Q0FCS8_9ROSI|nr:hypothetical protein Tsubulata_007383 [Turnera subulata]